MDYIAQAPLRMDSLDELLGRISQSQAPVWYALIDTAFDHEKPPFPLPEGSLNCYEGHPILEKLAPVAPVLVPLHRADISALLAHCDGRPMLSFLMLEEGQDVSMVVTQWMPLHRIEVPDGEQYLLRFADTYVLADFPKMLTEAQRLAWHVGIAEWHYINRAGVPQKLPHPLWVDPMLKHLFKSKPQKEISPAKKIVLDDAQFASVMDRGETEEILAYFNEKKTSVFLKGIPGAEYYKYSEAALDVARRNGIENMKDKRFLVMINATTNGRFVQTPELEPYLKAKRWTAGGLGTALAGETWVLGKSG